MLLALVVALPGAEALSQTVTVKSLPELDVTLIAPGTPEFEAALPGVLSPWLARAGGNVSMRMVDPLLPFSVIVVNQSDRGIRSITLRWACVDSVGRTSVGFHGEGSSSKRPGPGQKLFVAPQGSILFTPAQPESLPLRERRFGSTGIERTVQGYRSSKDVVISIDAVLFDDGRLAGPGESGMAKSIVGQFAAAREIQSTVLARLERRESTITILQWVASQAGPPMPPQPRAPADEWRRYWKSVIARDAAAVRMRKGDDAAIAMIRGLDVGPPAENALRP